MLPKVILPLVAVAVTSGCAQRTPTLPDVAPDQRAPIEKTEDWENWGPKENKDRREAAIEGTRINADQIMAVFNNKVLRGCYPNGDAFAEFLDDDGKFYDGMKGNAFLGTWAARNAELCFRYPERAEQGAADSCFVVVKASNRYDFYTSDLKQKVASTLCPK